MHAIRGEKTMIDRVAGGDAMDTARCSVYLVAMLAKCGKPTEDCFTVVTQSCI